MILSIFYYEYEQAISNRDLKKRKSYLFMRYVGSSRKNWVCTQLSGLTLLLFVVFIRYSCFGLVNNPTNVSHGRWPRELNAAFNGIAPYLFIMAHVLILLPVFIGKLSIVRDIYAAPFFRPFARINLSVALIQGLTLYFFFFSQQ